MRFRFDDISINSDMNLVQKMTNLIYNHFPDCQIIYGVSPLVHDMSAFNDKNSQRIFPQILNAMSDPLLHFLVDKAGVPEIGGGATLAGHGLVHLDHRLMGRQAQTMSILISCSLVKASVFIPPFNKWNKKTEEICNKNGIELIKFEDGWLCAEYNEFDPKHELWYIHAREFTYEKFKTWLTKQDSQN